MADISAVYAHADGLASVTSATWTSMVSVDSGEFADDEDWIFFHLIDAGGSDSAAATTNFRALYPDGSTIQYLLNHEPATTSNAQLSRLGMMKRITDQTASPGDLQGQYSESGSVTAYYRNATVLGLRLDDLAAGDFAYDDDGTDYTHTTTLATHSSVSPTTTSGEKWLIIACARVQINQTNNSFEIAIDKGGTDKVNALWEGEDTASELTLIVSWVDDSPDSETATYAVQTRDDGGATFNHTIFSSIFALRLDAFDDFSQARSATFDFVGSSAFEVLETFTHTPDTTANHIVWGGFVADVDSQGDSVRNKLQFDDVDGDSLSIQNHTLFSADDRQPQTVFELKSIASTGVKHDLEALTNDHTGTLQLEETHLVTFSVTLADAGTVTPATIVTTVAMPAPTINYGTSASPATIVTTVAMPAPAIAAGAGLAPATIVTTVAIPAVEHVGTVRPTAQFVLAMDTTSRFDLDMDTTSRFDLDMDTTSRFDLGMDTTSRFDLEMDTTSRFGLLLE